MAFSISLGLVGDKASRFLDRLRAEISFEGGYTGTHGHTADGTFVNIVSGSIMVAGELHPVDLRLTWSSSDALGALEATSDAPDGWQDTIRTWTDNALVGALAEESERKYYKEIFAYMGPPMQGEYWLDGYRVSPFEPEGMGPVEQVVALESYVDAVDAEHGFRVGRVQTYRFASLLSLFLRIGLYRGPMEMRWIREEDGSYRRAAVTLPKGAMPKHTERPKKGDLLPLGPYTDIDRSQLAFVDPIAPLKVPRDVRRLFRAVRSLTPAEREAYFGAAALARIATCLDRRFPSASLAYWVAAVDALPETDGSRGAFDAVVGRLCPDAPDVIPDWAFGRVRSAHFHAGALPAGETKEVDGFTIFSGPDDVSRARVSAWLPVVMHATLVRWLLERGGSELDEVAF